MFLTQIDGVGEAFDQVKAFATPTLLRTYLKVNPRRHSPDHPKLSCVLRDAFAWAAGDLEEQANVARGYRGLQDPKDIYGRDQLIEGAQLGIGGFMVLHDV